MHTALDDRTRPVYSEVHADETAVTAVALRWFLQGFASPEQRCLTRSNWSSRTKPWILGSMRRSSGVR